MRSAVDWSAPILDRVGRSIGTGDFNDDGHSDILWQNTSGQVAIWEMNGTNEISGGLVGSNPGSSWKAIGTGDFNGDGHSDILWQNTSGQVAIREMNGTNEIGGGLVGSNSGPSWKAIGTGDFNGDGHSDILWQNASSGQVAIWEMNGTNVIGGGTVSANPAPSLLATGTGEFQWRWLFRYSIPEPEWSGDHLGNERGQRDRRRARWRQSGAKLACGRCLRKGVPNSQKEPFGVLFGKINACRRGSGTNALTFNCAGGGGTERGLARRYRGRPAARGDDRG